MDFKTTNDEILVRNCALIQLQQLKNTEKNDSISVAVNEFKNLIDVLNHSNIEKAKLLLSNASSKQFKEFSESLAITPAKDFAQYHIDLIERYFKK